MASAMLSLGSTQNLLSLNLVSDSLANVLPGANKILKTNALTVSRNAKLDLNDNDAIVQATAALFPVVVAEPAQCGVFQPQPGRERGTREELMHHDGLYRKLYEIQYREAAAVV